VPGRVMDAEGIKVREVAGTMGPGDQFGSVYSSDYVDAYKYVYLHLSISWGRRGLILPHGQRPTPWPGACSLCPAFVYSNYPDCSLGHVYKPFFVSQHLSWPFHSAPRSRVSSPELSCRKADETRIGCSAVRAILHVRATLRIICGPSIHFIVRDRRKTSSGNQR